MTHESGYGWWGLAALNAAALLLFAASFTALPRGRDWRSFGAFSAFVVALFAEMYGFPLTIYLLSGWLASRIPGFDAFAHDSGHLWFDLLGIEGDPHTHPVHLIANVLILAGVGLVAWGWRRLFDAQVTKSLATTGPYRWVRHPQYVGFVAVMFGFLVMWPTLPTVLMFPVLVWIYARLARREEADVRRAFGAAWDAYAAVTPRFIPGSRPPRPPLDTAPLIPGRL